MTEILRERAAAGVGVVFSSHQLDLVEDVCEDVVIIDRGRIAANGAIDELRAASSRRHLEVEVEGTGTRGSTAGRADDRRAEGRLRPAARPGRRRPQRAARGGVRGRSGPPLRVPAADPLGAVHGGGPVMSRARRIWLVARRELVERGRSRAFLISLVAHGRLHRRRDLPADAHRRRGPGPTTSGVVGTPPAGFEQALDGDRGAGPARRSSSSPFRTSATGEARLNEGTLDALLVVPAESAVDAEYVVKERDNSSFAAGRGIGVVGRVGEPGPDRRRDRPGDGGSRVAAADAARARAIRPEPRHRVRLRQRRRDPPVHRDLHVRDVGPDRRRRGEAEPRRRGRALDRPGARPAGRQGPRDRPARARPARDHHRRSG